MTSRKRPAWLRNTSACSAEEEPRPWRPQRPWLALSALVASTICSLCMLAIILALVLR